MGVVDIGSNSVRLVVYEGAVRSPTPIFNEKVLCGLGRQVGSTGHLGEESVDAGAGGAEPLQGHRQDPRRQERRGRSPRPPAGTPPTAPSSSPAASARWARASRSFRPARGRACRQRHHDGLPLARRPGRRPRRRQPGADRGRGRGLAPIASRCRSAACGCSMPPAAGSSAPSTSPTTRSPACPGSATGATAPSTRSAARGGRSPGCTWRNRATRCTSCTATPCRPRRRSSSARRSARPRSSPRCRASRSSPSSGARCCPTARWCWSGCSSGWSPSAVDFSVFGIREGLVYSLLSETERRKDPLLSFCAEYARQRSRSAEHAFELCAWSDALFEPPGPKETDEERRLRHAACLLSDISWRAHPDYRGEQSLILIAHAALGGIDHPGRVFLALASYFRHIGISGDAEAEDKDQLSERLKAIVLEEALQARPHRRGGDPRRAHAVDRPPGIIDETPLVLRAQQAGADRAQGLRGARRRAPAPPLCRAGRAAGASRDPRRKSRLRSEGSGWNARAVGSRRRSLACHLRPQGIARLGARAPRSCSSMA